jgi:gliding motility-associated-like protein
VYTLTVTRLDNGCSDTDSVLVNQAPEPAFVPTAEQPDCLNPLGRIDIAAEPEAVKPLGYSINGGLTFQTTPVFYQLEPGMYTLILRDAYGCTAAEAVELDPPAYPEVLLPPTYTMPLGDSVFLTPPTVPPASGIASWTWTPAVDLSCADCPEPAAKPLLTRQYRLSITDINGCTAEATTRVLVDRGRKVYAPNIFSPDDDGRDDRFILYAKAAVDIESIHVFDRWGSLVWQGAHITPGDESAGWDGRIQGELPSPAVYVWQARIKFVDGQTELFEGDVTVLR